MGSKPLIRPPRLVRGSRVALVAPAGPLLERDDLTRAEALCRALGYEPALGPNTAQRYGYLAGTDDERLADLNGALRDPAVAAIWCIRGGYGVDPDAGPGGLRRARPRARRPLIGYSDITALLNAVAASRRSGDLSRPGGPGQHAAVQPLALRAGARPRRARRPPGPAARAARRAGAPGEPHRDPARRRCRGTAGGRESHPAPVPGRHAATSPTSTEPSCSWKTWARTSTGSTGCWPTSGWSGALGRLAGVVVGRFTELKRSMATARLASTRCSRPIFAPLGIPVAYGFPVGHIDDQWTLPLGVRARLDADAGELELLEPAVSP